MAKQLAQTSQGGRLHLEVGDTQPIVFETFHLKVLLRIGQWNTKTTTLRTIKTATGYGDTVNHVIESDAGSQLLVGIYHIGCAQEWIPMHMLSERFFQSEITHFIPAGIEIEQAIKAYALLADDECTHRRVGLEATASAYANYLQRSL